MAHFDRDEMTYCANLVSTKGDRNVVRYPLTVASYLRLQASIAFKAGEYECSARLGEAATALNCDARNKHAPNWTHAESVLARTDD